MAHKDRISGHGHGMYYSLGKQSTTYATYEESIHIDVADVWR